MKKNRNKTERIVLDAVMVGVYIALSFLAVQVGGLKITFEHFPVVLMAVLFGPIDAMLVGGLGELINQLFTYGLTLTTALWVLPIVVRALVLGICGKVFQRQMGAQALREKGFSPIFLGVCIVSGILSSCLNTFAFYVDSKLLGYYSYALVFGALSARILLSIITSVIMAICTKAVMYALKKSKLTN